MARSALNLTGNALAAAVVARWEGVLEIPTDDAAVIAPDEPEVVSARSGGDV